MGVDLKFLKKAYDIIGNEHSKAIALRIAEKVNVKKDIVRMDTNNFCNIRCVICGRTSSEEKLR